MLKKTVAEKLPEPIGRPVKFDQEKFKKRKESQLFEAFRALFIAPSNYGKSHLIANFVLSRLHKQFHPKRIIIFSKTYKSDPSQLQLINECEKKVPNFMQSNCFEFIDPVMLDNIFQMNKMLKERNKNYKQYLIMIDDQISEATLTDKSMVSFMALSRHYDISTIFSQQAYKSLNPSVRKQISIIAVGKLNSTSEIISVLEDFNQGCGDTKKSALQ